MTDDEKPDLDQALAELGGIPYGSSEFEALVARWAPLIDRHRRSNRHHPEYFGEAGIGGMDLIDLVEMLCDWVAAAERVPGQGVDLAYNARIYDISPQLASILANTLARWPKSS